MLPLYLFKRFLISLTLLGLSVSSANAALFEVSSEFGVGTATRDDVSGLDWLDLTKTQNRSYNDISSKLGSGGEFEGWRYASITEIGLFFDHAGRTTTNIYQGDNAGNDPDGWMFQLLNLWGITTAPTSPFHPASEAMSGTSHEFINSSGPQFNVWGAALAIDFPFPPVNPTNENGDYALVQTLSPYPTTYSRTLVRPRLGSALVRSNLPVPAVPVPAAVWLFGTALIGLVGFSKRKARIAA